MMFRRGFFVLSAVALLNACGGQKQPASQTESSAPAASTQAPAVDTANTGNVTGVVKFVGTKPKAAKISMGADAVCKSQHTGDVLSEEVVVNDNNTLKFVYVYVKSGLGNATFPVSTTPVVFNQQGCLYTPHVVAVQAGQPIQVLNSDGVLHNVNARPTKNKGFNFGQPVQGMKTEKTFDQAEVMIPVKCDVHPWMHGWIGVQTHPFAAVTNETGSFSLNNLPPGTYEIEAWHEKYGTSVQTVTIGAKETKNIEFTFKAS